MGWVNCGEDSDGRPIGYAHQATCDHEGCEKDIHRGLSYACGGMHGQDVYGCEKYFCEDHMTYVGTINGGKEICTDCYKMYEEEGRINEEGDIIEPE